MIVGCNPRGAPRIASGHARHIPVLLAEVLEHLQPKTGANYIDATFGAGGMTRAILQAADCCVLALDRDRSAVASGAALVEEFAPRLTLVAARFGELTHLPALRTLGPVDGVVFDLGVSSLQLDAAERGFSFQSDGPLDMRMSQASGPTAADIVNGQDEAVLADLLLRLGEERRARAVARAIVAARRRQPIVRTGQLAEIVAAVFGRRTAEARHPATRTFLALRIAVNDELAETAHGVSAAERVLRPGGRLAVVAFHSLEDRIVKRFFNLRAGLAADGSRHRPEAPMRRASTFRVLNRRPVTPSPEEIAANPRSRSAKLRAGSRTEAPAWPLDLSELAVPDVDLADMSGA
ncbi:MAG: 16S rRNA (cytosine(1402)-N(4))-methyltransferase RsmH [Hyphomicrobiaceae bacterium]